jgi:hypothetical protein
MVAAGSKFPSMKNQVLVFLSIAILAVSACKKKDDAGTNAPAKPDYLLYVHFSANYYGNQPALVIFISDMNGRLLADTSLSGINDVKIFPDNPASGIPDKMMVTVFNAYNYGVKGSGSVSLITYAGVQPGDWTFHGNEIAGPVGQARLVFENIPQPAAMEYFYLSQYGSWRTYAELPSVIDGIGINQDPEYFYLKVNTRAAGLKYKWINDVSKDTSVTVDLSVMDTPLEKNISIPFTADHYWADLLGYRTAGDYKGYYRLEDVMNYSFDTAVSSLTLHYPSSGIAKFQTEIELRDAARKDRYYFQANFGDIPSAFNRTDADVVISNSSPKQFNMHITGSCTNAYLSWSYMGMINYYNWMIFCPSDQTGCTFPDLPAYLSGLYPDLRADSLKLWGVMLYQLPGISYQEYINILFNPDFYAGYSIPEYRMVDIDPDTSGLKSTLKRERVRNEYPLLPVSFAN